MCAGRARADRPRVRAARRSPAARAVDAVLRRGAHPCAGRAARTQPALKPSARGAALSRRRGARGARYGGCTPRCASRWSATPTSRPLSTSPTTSSSRTCPTSAPAWTGRQLLQADARRLATASLERSLASHRRVARESLHLTDASAPTSRRSTSRPTCSPAPRSSTSVAALQPDHRRPHARPRAGSARGTARGRRRARRHRRRARRRPRRPGAARARRRLGDRLARPAPPADRSRPRAGALRRHAPRRHRVRVAA